MSEVLVISVPYCARVAMLRERISDDVTLGAGVFGFAVPTTRWEFAFETVDSLPNQLMEPSEGKRALNPGAGIIWSPDQERYPEEFVVPVMVGCP